MSTHTHAHTHTQNQRGIPYRATIVLAWSSRALVRSPLATATTLRCRVTPCEYVSSLCSNANYSKHRLYSARSGRKKKRAVRPHNFKQRHGRRVKGGMAITYPLRPPSTSAASASTVSSFRRRCSRRSGSCGSGGGRGGHSSRYRVRCGGWSRHSWCCRCLRRYNWCRKWCRCWCRCFNKRWRLDRLCAMRVKRTG